jgi:hypothetical protein
MEWHWPSSCSSLLNGFREQKPTRFRWWHHFHSFPKHCSLISSLSNSYYFINQILRPLFYLIVANSLRVSKSECRLTSIRIKDKHCKNTCNLNTTVQYFNSMNIWEFSFSIPFPFPFDIFIMVLKPIDSPTRLSKHQPQWCWTEEVYYEKYMSYIEKYIRQRKRMSFDTIIFTFQC